MAIGGAECGIGDYIVQNPDKWAAAEFRGKRANEQRLLRIGADYVVMSRLLAQLPSDGDNIGRATQHCAKR